MFPLQVLCKKHNNLVKKSTEEHTKTNQTEMILEETNLGFDVMWLLLVDYCYACHCNCFIDSLFCLLFLDDKKGVGLGVEGDAAL